MSPRKNLLLAAMEPKSLRLIEDHLEPVKFNLKDVLHEREQNITHVYFPTDGVVSMVNEPEPGEIVEIATIGYEGLVGIPVILGGFAMPSLAFVQVPGEGLKLATPHFMEAMKRDERFHDLLLRYMLALVNQIAHSASCNRLHEVQERCARWLLQTHDRVSGDTFPLTHEFLGQMLGVHRPTVSVAAGILQKAGLIEYTRGMITIIDRKGLENASCPCYRLITNEYDRLLNHKFEVGEPLTPQSE
jgi:CRP-like cAMP-binding protein